MGLPVFCCGGGGGGGAGAPSQIILVTNSAPITIPSGVYSYIVFDTILFQLGTDFGLAGGNVSTGTIATFLAVETAVYIDENGTGSRLVNAFPGITAEYPGLVGGMVSPKQLLAVSGFGPPQFGVAGVAVEQNSGIDLIVGASGAVLQVAGW